jgi:hypothetical protein
MSDYPTYQDLGPGIRKKLPCGFHRGVSRKSKNDDE